jgi:rhamnulokinase
VLGRRFDVIHLVGGGGRNALLNQMTADATGRRVVVGPHEATAVGNVLVQAMGAGKVRDRRHLRQIVADSLDLSTFEPLDTGPWEAAAARYDAILR